MDPDNPSPADPAELPLGHENYAGEVQVANGKMPSWLKWVPYVAIILALGYYLWVRATDPVNLVFAALFVIWLIYTPIAQRRGWFHIPM